MRIHKRATTLRARRAAIAFFLLAVFAQTTVIAATRRGVFPVDGPTRSHGLLNDGSAWTPVDGRGGEVIVRVAGLPGRVSEISLAADAGAGWSVAARRRGSAWVTLAPDSARSLPGSGVIEVRLTAIATAAPSAPALDLAWETSSGSASPAPVPTPVLGYVRDDPPEIVRRGEWGAHAPFEDYDRHTPEAIVVHHSWLPTAKHYGRTGGAESVAGIQRFHMFDPARGWNDVGYHFLIGPDGLVFEARPPSAVGAHAVPNTGKLGICMIGNHDPEGDVVTMEAWDALEDLVASLAHRYDIPMTELYGHRNFSHKTCPGDRIFNRFTELREEVHRRIGTMGID